MNVVHCIQCGGIQANGIIWIGSKPAAEVARVLGARSEPRSWHGIIIVVLLETFISERPAFHRIKRH
jgi:hypothetical protein